MERDPPLRENDDDSWERGRSALRPYKEADMWGWRRERDVDR